MHMKLIKRVMRLTFRETWFGQDGLGRALSLNAQIFHGEPWASLSILGRSSKPSYYLPTAGRHVLGGRVANWKRGKLESND